MIVRFPRLRHEWRTGYYTYASDAFWTSRMGLDATPRSAEAEVAAWTSAQRVQALTMSAAASMEP